MNFPFFKRFPLSSENPPPATTSSEPNPFQTILSSMAESVLVIDRPKKVLYANPSMASLLSISPEEALGRSLLEILRHREIEDTADRVFATHTPETREILFSFPRETLWQLRAAPLSFENISAVLLTFNDLTHVRRLETQRRDFVANVSHELKTPLTALRAALETLLDGALEDPAHAREFLNTAETQVLRLQRLIDDLLILSRLEKPGLPSPLSKGASWEEVSRRVTTALTPLAKQSKVTILNHPSPHPLWIEMTSDELTQILINLIDNGIKFNKPGGSVELRIKMEGSSAVIDVEDTGVGIPPQDLPRIFERFYRVDKAHSQNVAGTGLGLAIVKHTVENRNGRINVESAINQGSRFSLTLPLYRSSAKTS